MNELSSHAKGVLTELAVQQAFISHGFGISVPVLPTSRYDMIVDTGSNLIKVQVKTARDIPDSDGFMISLRSSRTHRWGVQSVRYTADDVDMFATVHDGNVYVIPQIDVDGQTQCIFRNNCANGQIKGIRFAKDYELNNVIANNSGSMLLPMN